MKKNFSLITIFFVGIFVSRTQEVKTTSFPMKESSLLWKIEGPGIEKPSYLYGTMHLIEKEYFFFPEKLEKIIKKSDQIVLEIADQPTAQEAEQMVTLKEGTFFDFFTSEETDSIFKWAQDEMKMDEKSFRAMMLKKKPFFVVQLVDYIQLMGKTESYELTIDKIAKDNNIEVKGFETIEQQMSIFDNLTEDQQSEMVMEAIRNSGKSLKLIERMEKMYVGQNVDSLYMLVDNEDDVLSEEQASILDDRNANWIPQIVTLIADKKTFIAVGAAHLGGPNGVIRLLERKGYTLTPVEL